MKCLPAMFFSDNSCLFFSASFVYDIAGKTFEIWCKVFFSLSEANFHSLFTVTPYNGLYE